MQHTRCLVAGVLFLFAFTAVAPQLAGQQQKSENPPAGESAKPTASPAPPPDATAPVDPKTYKIGPEDVIRISVWREPELSGVISVRPDGRITLPLVGEVDAGGLTPEALKEKVTDAYSKVVNKPEVMVSLMQVGSKKYYLVGEVARPGWFPLVVPTTVLEAINGAGGFREFANKKNIVILRGIKRLKFNYEEVIKGKKLDQNVLVEPGDHIIVR